MGNSQTLKDIAKDFLRKCIAGHVKDAFALYTAENFVHHNPYFAGDAASLKAGMQDSADQNPGATLRFVQALAEDDRVAVHSQFRSSPEDPGGAVVHLFRFEEDKIAEFWDVFMPVPEELVNQEGLF